MHSTDIVGYTLNADNLCEECARQWALGKLIEMNSKGNIWGDNNRTEHILDMLAAEMNIDRYDERSYDSSEFPKVIFADSVHDVCFPENGYNVGQCGDKCGNCAVPLGYECPNNALDYWGI